jgi:hypothetical protein
VPIGCNSMKNLRSPSGVYLKTVCLQIGFQTQPQIIDYCIANGMELFTVDSPEVEAAIIAHSDKLYPSGWLWIAGKTGTTCNVLNRKNSLSSFFKTTCSCTQLNYSFCGYTSKKKLNFCENFLTKNNFILEPAT